jgi:tetratricopeptide (TPR) repeat protein
MGRPLQFEEFALRIQPAGAGRWAVQVTKSPYGSKASSELIVVPHEEPGLAQALEAAVRGTRGVRRNFSEDSDDEVLAPQAVGDRLFRSLFSGPILETFLMSLGRVEHQADSGLRIRLTFDPSLPNLPEVIGLPWELLYRSDTRDFLARNPLTPVVRYLEVPRLTAPAPLTSSLRILVVRSGPSDVAHLDLDSERDRLIDAWGGKEQVEIEILDRPNLLSLRRKLMGASFHILHFMGHGDFDAQSGEGVLVFEDAAGRSTHVSGAVLAEALKDSRSLRLVFLNACDTAQLGRRRGQDPFSGVASALVMAGLPAVLAMQLPISDAAALVFSGHFYAALAAGFPVDAAAAEARLAIHLSFPASWEWATPALFMSVPDGRILLSENQEQDIKRAAPAPSPPPAGGSGSPTFNIGSIGNGSQIGQTVNIGAGNTGHIGDVIHNITNVHNTTNVTTLDELDQMDPAKKRDLLTRYQDQVRDFPEKAQVHLALGLSYLDLRLYDQALTSLKQALGKGSQEAGLYFYIALASVGGKQPRVLTLARIKEIEGYLEAAIRSGAGPEARLLWAIIKYDYYRANGLRVPPPSIEELLDDARHGTSGDAHLIPKHVTVPAPLRQALS